MIALLAFGCAEPPPPPLPAARCDRARRGELEVVRVDDQVLVVRAPPDRVLSFVITPAGVVAVDTGTAPAARAAREVLGELTDLPLVAVLVTSETQLAGAAALEAPGVRFVGHEALPLALDWVTDTAPFQRRATRMQFGVDLSAAATHPRRPDTTYADLLAFELGGTRFELHHAEGPSRAGTVVHLPDRGYVWAGDLVTRGFPKVAGPLEPPRDPARWQAAVDRVRALRPAVLIDTFDGPVCDRAQIDARLELEREALGFVHEAVVGQLAAGATAEEAVRAIRLPSHLHALPHGAVNLELAVRGLYHGYGQSFDPARFALPDQVARSFVDAMGGPEPVLASATHLAASGRIDLALEYLSLLADPRADQLEASLLLTLAEDPALPPHVSQLYRSLAQAPEAPAPEGAVGSGKRCGSVFHLGPGTPDRADP